jgi:2-amino-4-hydroxy-6-hydroxymethyldihydropteridine diphosphokinase
MVDSCGKAISFVNKAEKLFYSYFYTMHKAYILLGSNMGRRSSFLQKAKQQIELLSGRIVKESSVYQTAAWGNTKQQDFLNQIIIIQTKQLPHELMQTLLSIETNLGRVRTVKFGPRTIDLDILFYDDLIHRSPAVTLPHPAIQDRRFVLVPLAELSPRKIHPVYKQTVTQLLKECPDKLVVTKMNA